MCENLAQLQKSHQRLEKELTRRKDRETELLAFSEKLSSANAGLQAERTERESRVRGSLVTQPLLLPLN